MHARSLFFKMLNALQERIPEISLEKLLNKMKASGSFYLMDVRTSEEWEKGHIPNAVHLPRDHLEMSIEVEVPDPDACIIVYCGSGIRSLFAASTLQAMGYSNVYSLEGGIKKWQAYGLPLAFSQPII